MSQKIKIDKSDLQELMINSQRYAIGRMTCVPFVFKEIALKHLNDLTNDTIQVMIDDIETQRNRSNLGAECDKETWLSLLETLKDEIEKRGKK